MSTHTIFDELRAVATKAGVDTKNAHNIKDVIRLMSKAYGGDSNGKDIATTVRNAGDVVDITPVNNDSTDDSNTTNTTPGDNSGEDDEEESTTE